MNLLRKTRTRSHNRRRKTENYATPTMEIRIRSQYRLQRIHNLAVAIICSRIHWRATMPCTASLNTVHRTLQNAIPSWTIDNLHKRTSIGCRPISTPRSPTTANKTINNQWINIWWMKEKNNAKNIKLTHSHRATNSRIYTKRKTK